jgi:hypothetical protein
MLSEAKHLLGSSRPRCLILIDYMTTVIEINQILSPQKPAMSPERAD